MRRDTVPSHPTHLLSGHTQAHVPDYFLSAEAWLRNLNHDSILLLSVKNPREVCNL